MLSGATFFRGSLCLQLCVQVHLSDDVGMGVLVRLLWSAVHKQLEPPPPEPSPPPRVSPPASRPARKVSPRLVVEEVPAPPSPDAFQWRSAGRGSKVIITV